MPSDDRGALVESLPTLPDDLTIRTPRLRLDPVTRADALDVRALHSDPELFRHTARPRHLDECLDDWLAGQETRRSPTGSALWLTWLLRRLGDGDSAAAVGQVQSTVVAAEDAPQAELAWLVARSAQGHGLASEASAAVALWLAEHLSVRRLHAHIADGHAASERVAAHLGLQPSGELLDGERRWSGRAGHS